jgi:hypothetical protein
LLRFNHRYRSQQYLQYQQIRRQYSLHGRQALEQHLQFYQTGSNKMTFIPPEQTLDPIELRLANEILHQANIMLENLKKWRQEQYQLFWFNNGQLRSWSQINDILIEMDAAEVGQSGKFFASAVELVELILAIDPGSLQNSDWYPQYEYTVDGSGQIRMVEP